MPPTTSLLAALLVSLMVILAGASPLESPTLGRQMGCLGGRGASHVIAATLSLAVGWMHGKLRLGDAGFFTNRPPGTWHDCDPGLRSRIRGAPYRCVCDASTIDAASAIAAGGLYLGCLCVFWGRSQRTAPPPLSAAFSEDAPERRCSGPYRLVRHPSYAAYLLVWSAWSDSGGGWLPWHLSSSCFVLYSVAARSEEAKFRP